MEEKNAKPSYCPHCGVMKPLTERYCPMCGKDRSGTYAPYFTNAVNEMARQNNTYTLSEAETENRRRISGKACAIAALVVSLVNLMSLTLLTPVALPLVIIFIAISIKRKGGAHGMAIAAAVISIITTIFFAFMVYIIVKIAPDIKYFVNNDEQIVMEYDKYGTIPDRFDKYRDSKYDKWWDAMGYDSFDEFFGDYIIENYRKSTLKGKHYDKEDSPEDTTESSTENSTQNSTSSPPTTETTTEKIFSEDVVSF